jgi:hypothetical protein
MNAKSILFNLIVFLFLSFFVSAHIEILWNKVPQFWIVFPLFCAFLIGIQAIYLLNKLKIKKL